MKNIPNYIFLNMSFKILKTLYCLSAHFRKRLIENQSRHPNLERQYQIETAFNGFVAKVSSGLEPIAPVLLGLSAMEEARISLFFSAFDQDER